MRILGNIEQPVVVDVTTIGEQGALDLLHAGRGPVRLALASLPTNPVRMYRANGAEMRDDGWLPTLFALKT